MKRIWHKDRLLKHAFLPRTISYVDTTSTKEWLFSGGQGTCTTEDKWKAKTGQKIFTHIEKEIDVHFPKKS